MIQKRHHGQRACQTATVTEPRGTGGRGMLHSSQSRLLERFPRRLDSKGVYGSSRWEPPQHLHTLHCTALLHSTRVCVILAQTEVSGSVESAAVSHPNAQDPRNQSNSAVQGKSYSSERHGGTKPRCGRVRQRRTGKARRAFANLSARHPASSTPQRSPKKGIKAIMQS